MNSENQADAKKFPTDPPDRCIGISSWLSWGVSAALLCYYYFFVQRYGATRGETTLGWLYGAWNGETDYEHGIMFPFIIVGLVVYRWKELREGVGRGSWWGLIPVVIGTLFYLAAYRTFQPRVAVGALPFLLWGSVWTLWGWRAAKVLTFPFFFLWLSIPLPSFQQATTSLQLLATSLTHHGASLLGVETVVKGTTILPLESNWEPLDIAGGCSGIRSLMALLMFSSAWAYIAKISWWKKLVLFASAFPLAILGNALRVISIFVISEYGDAKWARETWHDWSGLLLFYPFSLFLMLILHSLLEGGPPWKSAQRRKLIRIVVTRQTQPES